MILKSFYTSLQELCAIKLGYVPEVLDNSLHRTRRFCGIILNILEVLENRFNLLFKFQDDENGVQWFDLTSDPILVIEEFDSKVPRLQRRMQKLSVNVLIYETPTGGKKIIFSDCLFGDSFEFIINNFEFNQSPVVQKRMNDKITQLKNICINRIRRTEELYD
jgi:hypothetical protein